MHVRTGNGLLTSGCDPRRSSPYPEAPYRVLQRWYSPQGPYLDGQIRQPATLDRNGARSNPRHWWAAADSPLQNQKDSDFAGVTPEFLWIWNSSIVRFVAVDPGFPILTDGLNSLRCREILASR